MERVIPDNRYKPIRNLLRPGGIFPFNDSNGAGQDNKRRIAELRDQLPGHSTLYRKPGRYNAARLTKSLSPELGPAGITVNSLSPGWFNTKGQTNALFENENWIAGLMGNTQLKRLGMPNNLAEAVVFLPSDASAYITDQMLLVDGGVSIIRYELCRTLKFLNLTVAVGYEYTGILI